MLASPARPLNATRKQEPILFLSRGHVPGADVMVEQRALTDLGYAGSAMRVVRRSRIDDVSLSPAINGGQQR
jgi:hypothetical protein